MPLFELRIGRIRTRPRDGKTALVHNSRSVAYTMWCVPGSSPRIRSSVYYPCIFAPDSSSRGRLFSVCSERPLSDILILQGALDKRTASESGLQRTAAVMSGLSQAVSTHLRSIESELTERAWQKTSAANGEIETRLVYHVGHATQLCS